jgi:hypothetical protein
MNPFNRQVCGIAACPGSSELGILREAVLAGEGGVS